MEIRAPFDLYINKRDKNVSLKKYTALAKKLIRSQAVKVISGNRTDFDKDFTGLITSIWQDGYSKGLADMDKMHGEADKENFNE